MQTTKRRFPLTEILLGLLIFFLHYTELFTFQIRHASLMLLLPLLLTVAMNDTGMGGLLYGLFFGLLCDSVSSFSACYHTLFFMFCGFAVSALSRYIFNRNLPAAITLSLVFSLLYFGLKWLIFYYFTGVQGKMFYLLQFSLPSALFTGVSILPFYFIERALSRRFARRHRSL